jgi:hypothetical protein
MVIMTAFQGMLSTTNLHVACISCWQWIFFSHMTMCFLCFLYTYCAVCIGPSQDGRWKRRDGAFCFNSVVLCSIMGVWACVWSSVYVVLLKKVVTSVLLHVTYILIKFNKWALCCSRMMYSLFWFRLLMMVLVALLIVNCECMVIWTACVLVMRQPYINLVVWCDVWVTSHHTTRR